MLWAARGGLLAIFVLHIWLAARLKFRNWAARPTRYAYEDTVQATWASRTMIWSGLVILAFVIFHLLHYTFGLAFATAPNGTNFLDLHESLNQASPHDPAQRHDVYAMTVYGFRNVPVAIAYIIAQLFLGLHLSHGVSSSFQSMGWNAPRWWRLIHGIGLAIAHHRRDRQYRDAVGGYDRLDRQRHSEIAACGLATHAKPQAAK